MSETKKVLVHLHLFYEDQADYFISKLKNINGCLWDLYLSYVDCNNETLNKFLLFKADTKLIKVENIGYDIIPFFKILNLVNLENYDYVLKIHTKNKRDYITLTKGFDPKILYIQRYEWKNVLVDALLLSKQKFRKNLKIISQNKIGIIGSKIFCFDVAKRNKPEDTYLLSQLKDKLGITTSYPLFIACTMFFAKAQVLEKLKTITLAEDISNKTGSCGTPVHAIERIFTILAVNMGYEVYWVNNLMYRLKILLRHIKHLLFDIKLSKDKKKTNSCNPGS
ncbi:hypothetical protein IJ182_06450 [bacterium]|nr:hypothetical protein [bacterium]